MLRFLSVLILSCLMSFSAWAEVNLNIASQAELESLPGIGPAKANAIIAFRSENGRFRSLADLDRVPGIGPATLANLSPLVSFTGETVTPAVYSSAGRDVQVLPVSNQVTVNVNTAASSALESLPGIGPAKAAAIIADRETNGPFPSCAQLQRVRGIGPATVANISGRCTVK